MKKAQRSSLTILEEPTAAGLQIIKVRLEKVSYKEPLRHFADTQWLCRKDQNKGETLASKAIVSVNLKFTVKKLREGCKEMKEERKKSVLKITSRK